MTRSVKKWDALFVIYKRLKSGVYEILNDLESQVLFSSGQSQNLRIPGNVVFRLLQSNSTGRVNVCVQKGDLLERLTMAGLKQKGQESNTCSILEAGCQSLENVGPRASERMPQQWDR